jgi:hypothetical protein
MIETWQTKEGLLIKIHLQPKASKNELVGNYQGALKVRITAAPTDNQANKALIVFLANSFGVKKSQVKIISGHTGRDKTVSFSGCDVALIKQMLAKFTGTKL